MAYSLPASLVILFGGDAGGNTPLGDTWSWNGTSWTHIADFGPSPRFHASMASSDMQISLFGGVTSVILTPAPTVFPDSWIFDGKRWSQRQDIGPGPRWGHALALDSSRRQTVLFGGLRLAVSGAGDPFADPLGDTWEHLETGTVAPPGTPAVASFTLQPQSGATGSPVVATVVLAQASNATIAVGIEWTAADAPQTVISVVGTGTIPANIPSAKFSFTVPTHSNPPTTGTLIFLSLNGQRAASANFNNLD
jgi:hypothetical protein